MPIEKTTSNGYPQESDGIVSQFDVDKTQSEPLINGGENIIEKTYQAEREISPLEQVKIEEYKAQIKTENWKTLSWKVLVFAIPAFLTVLSILIGLYFNQFTYYLKEVSGPMSSMQTELSNIKETNLRLEGEIKDLRTLLNLKNVTK